MKVNNKHFVKAQPMNTDFFSEPQQLNQMYGYAVQAVITGTPAGIINLQASCDPNDRSDEPVNWDNITDSYFTVTTSGTCTWNIDGAFYNWVRVQYVDQSAGTSNAVVDVRINIKGV